MDSKQRQSLEMLLSHPNLKALCNDSKLLSCLEKRETSPVARKQYLYLRAYWDFKFFVQLFFGHHCQKPFSSMHEDFCLDEENPNRRGRRDVVAAPRGNAKTTFKVLFKALHAIVYGYESFIVIIGYSAPEAEKKVKEILEELEENTLLREVYGSLAPVRAKQSMGQWGTKDFITRNGIRVLAKSRGKQVRGLKHGAHRPSLIILDDIEAPDKVLNEGQRKKTKDWLEKDILKLGPADSSHNVVVIGTCLHMESLLSELLVHPAWYARKYQSVSSFSSREDLWQQWRTIYTDLYRPDRELEADAFFRENRTEMLEGTDVLWPEGEPYIVLMKMLVNEGQASFQSEKQNEPYDPELQIFPMTLAKRFQLSWEDGDDFSIHWLNGSERIIEKDDIERVVIFHDPAVAEKTVSDYAALVVCAKDRYGYYYCLDAVVEKMTPSQQIARGIALYQKWQADCLYVETNNFQTLLKSHYLDQREQYPELRIMGVDQYVNKLKRISSLEPLIRNGQLLFSQDLSHRFISQMTLFPTTHDDGPDALHGAIEQLRKSLGRIQAQHRSTGLF